MKKIRVFFLSENFQLLLVKFSIYLNRRVFIMNSVGKSYDNRGWQSVVFYPTQNIIVIG